MARIATFVEFVEATDAILSPLLAKMGFVPKAATHSSISDSYSREYIGVHCSFKVIYDRRDLLIDIYVLRSDDKDRRGPRLNTYLTSKHGKEIESIKSSVFPRKKDLESMLNGWRDIIDSYRSDFEDC